MKEGRYEKGAVLQMFFIIGVLKNFLIVKKKHLC